MTASAPPGLALATIEEVSRLCASPVHTAGSFTPKGFRSLAAKQPVHTGCEARQNFGDVPFVDDWDRRLLR